MDNITKKSATYTESIIQTKYGVRYSCEVVVEISQLKFRTLTTRPTRFKFDAKVRVAHNMLLLLSKESNLETKLRKECREAFIQVYFYGLEYEKDMIMKLKEREYIEFKGADSSDGLQQQGNHFNLEAAKKAIKEHLARFIATAVNSRFLQKAVEVSQVSFYCRIHYKGRVHGIHFWLDPNQSVNDFVSNHQKSLLQSCLQIFLKKGFFREARRFQRHW